MTYAQRYLSHLEKTGYDTRTRGCERCHVTTAIAYDVHHIYYRSEIPKHKHLDHVKNLIYLCRKCHDWFHGGKERRLALVEQRQLNNLINSHT